MLLILGFTLDETGGKIYVNGELISSDTWTGESGSCANNFLWKIGGFYNDWFHGKIDDIGIWNRTLSEQEIEKLYRGTQQTTLEINCPESITVVCINEVQLPDTSLVKVTGNCKNITIKFVSDISDGMSSPETITRTYKATDDCGNAVICSQLIFVDDVTPPYIFCPSDISVKNESEIPKPLSSFDEFINNKGKVSDNCEIVTGSFELFYTFLDTLVIPSELKRTYIISDKAGNESVCLHKIAIENATSLNEINSTNEFHFKVYPNPANEYVTFDIQNIENLTDYSLNITNILGQKIFQTEIYQPIFKLDCRNWGGKGLHFVNIVNSFGVTIDKKKIVIQ